MRRSDSRSPVPPRFVSFTWRYATQARSAGSPRFLWSPRVRAELFDPGGAGHTRPLGCAGTAFHLTDGVGPRDEMVSGLNHTARKLAVYASQGGSLLHHARLATGRRPRFAGRDWLPAGLLRRFQPCISHGIPLPQASPGAPVIHPIPSLGHCPHSASPRPLPCGTWAVG